MHNGRMSWPSYVINFIHDQSLTPDAASRRTQFDSGAISQKRPNTRAWRTLSFQAAVLNENIPDFQTWMTDTQDSFFDFRDFFDGVTRRVRVQNGAHNMTLRKVENDKLEPEGNRLNRDGYVIVDVVLEGYG